MNGVTLIVADEAPRNGPSRRVALIELGRAVLERPLQRAELLGQRCEMRLLADHRREPPEAMSDRGALVHEARDERKLAADRDELVGGASADAVLVEARLVERREERRVAHAALELLMAATDVGSSLAIGIGQMDGGRLVELLEHGAEDRVAISGSATNVDRVLHAVEAHVELGECHGLGIDVGANEAPAVQSVAQQRVDAAGSHSSATPAASIHQPRGTSAFSDM